MVDRYPDNVFINSDIVIIKPGRRQETGCRAEIVGPAWFVEYDVDGVPKITAFFPMELDEEVGAPEGPEVRSVHWLAPEEAQDRLTYDSERSIVAQRFARSAERSSKR